MAGSLVVVGVGMTFVSHLTLEARAHIEQADRVFLVLGDPAAVAWFESLNPRTELLRLYTERSPGGDTVGEWQAQIDAALETLLAPACAGASVCLVLDGHPAVMVPPAHEAIRLARERGLRATMLPGVSAEDCLFADLGVDPARDGCLSFEATDFLVRRRPVSVSSALVLRQIGLIGELMLMGRRNSRGLEVLTEVLSDSYGAEHEVVIYEAAAYAIGGPSVQRIPLSHLPEATVTDFSTLYVPPARRAPVDPAMLDRLGLAPARVRD